MSLLSNESTHHLFRAGALSIIFMIALIIRLFPVIALPENFRNGFGPFGDTHLYHRLAYNLYSGNGFSGIDDGRAYGFGKQEDVVHEPAITRGPVYPYFIYGVYKMIGNSDHMQSIETWHINLDKIRVIQCILDAILCFVIYFLVRLQYPVSFMPALISAFLYSISLYNIYYTRTLLTESVTTFLLTGFIFIWVLALRYKSMLYWLSAGLTLGLTILARPEYILFPVFFIGYNVILNRKKISASLGPSIIFLIGCIIVIFPWTIRNYIVFNKPIVVSASGIGFSLWLGTFETHKNWKGWGKYPDEIFDNHQEKEKIKKISRRYGHHLKRGTIGIVDADRDFKRLAINRIRNNPLECFRIWISRIPELWYQNYVKRYLYKEPSGFYFIFYFVFSMAAFIGSTKQEKLLMLPIGLLFLYLNLVFLPLHIEPRYGVALMPGLICLSGIGIWKTVGFLSKLNRKSNPAKVF